MAKKKEQANGVHLFQVEKLVIGINHDRKQHYYFALVDQKKFIMHFLDSLHEQNIANHRLAEGKILAFLHYFHRNYKKNSNITLPAHMNGVNILTKYKAEEVDFPQQLNGWDCAVFLCMGADCIALGINFDFDQTIMLHCRGRIANSLLTGYLPNHGPRQDKTNYEHLIIAPARRSTRIQSKLEISPKTGAPTSSSVARILGMPQANPKPARSDSSSASLPSGVPSDFMEELKDLDAESFLSRTNKTSPNETTQDEDLNRKPAAVPRQLNQEANKTPPKDAEPTQQKKDYPTTNQNKQQATSQSTSSATKNTRAHLPAPEHFNNTPKKRAIGNLVMGRKHEKTIATPTTTPTGKDMRPLPLKKTLQLCNSIPFYLLDGLQVGIMKNYTILPEPVIITPTNYTQEQYISADESLHHYATFVTAKTFTHRDHKQDKIITHNALPDDILCVKAFENPKSGVHLYPKTGKQTVEDQELVRYYAVPTKIFNTFKTNNMGELKLKEFFIAQKTPGQQ